MEIGVGLPAVIPGAPGELVLRWAREADDGPFSSLGVHDRLAFDSYECLTVLAAAAAVTKRIQLASLILIGPLRGSALLAKQAATVDALSAGRLTLGVGIGPRRDDYEVGEVRFTTRGRRLEEQLYALREHWEGTVIGPRSATPSGPRLLVGGGGDAALARMARHADGYVHGGGPIKAFRTAADRALAAWNDAERPSRPQLVGTAYFALDGRAAEGREDLLNYYGFVGPFAERIADGLLTSRAEIHELAAGYAEAGCDELVLFPTIADLRQLDLLAQTLD